MSHATVEEFLARIESDFVQQLTTDAVGPEADAERQARIQAALDDATGELDGFLGRVPDGQRPSAATLRVHCIKIALYLLATGRPGKDFESIRNAYKDTTTFYEGLLAADNPRAPIDGESDAPTETTTEDALKGFVT